MAKLVGWSVPEYLIPAWQRLGKITLGIDSDTLRLNYPTLSYGKKKQLKDYSLFVLWEPLWATFDSTRRIAWQTFWGGWPGSGYSSFVQINAPRYKAGLDLLLDPPSLGPEILLNGTFSAGLLHWNTINCLLEGGEVLIGQEASLSQEFSTQEAGEYYLTFDAVIRDLTTHDLILDPQDCNISFGGSHFTTINPSEQTHYTIPISVGGPQTSFTIFTTDTLAYIAVDNLTLQKLT